MVSVGSASIVNLFCFKSLLVMNQYIIRGWREGVFTYKVSFMMAICCSQVMISVCQPSDWRDQMQYGKSEDDFEAPRSKMDAELRSFVILQLQAAQASKTLLHDLPLQKVSNSQVVQALVPKAAT